MHVPPTYIYRFFGIFWGPKTLIFIGFFKIKTKSNIILFFPIKKAFIPTRFHNFSSDLITFFQKTYKNLYLIGPKPLLTVYSGSLYHKEPDAAILAFFRWIKPMFWLVSLFWSISTMVGWSEATSGWLLRSNQWLVGCSFSYLPIYIFF